jgi:hypothetical protein
MYYDTRQNASNTLRQSDIYGISRAWPTYKQELIFKYRCTWNEDAVPTPTNNRRYVKLREQKFNFHYSIEL